jgi:hypothetical protein
MDTTHFKNAISTFDPRISVERRPWKFIMRLRTLSSPSPLVCRVGAVAVSSRGKHHLAVSRYVYKHDPRNCCLTGA